MSIVTRDLTLIANSAALALARDYISEKHII